MKTHKIETQLLVPAPRAEVFKFFADPRNLERITPPWLHFEIITPPDTVIEPGTLLDYRLRLRGIPLRWQSEISVWEPPLRFVDRQTKGPYSLWVHEHTFADDRAAAVRSCRNFSSRRISRAFLLSAIESSSRFSARRPAHRRRSGPALEPFTTALFPTLRSIRYRREN